MLKLSLKNANAGTSERHGKSPECVPKHRPKIKRTPNERRKNQKKQGLIKSRPKPKKDIGKAGNKASQAQNESRPERGGGL